MFSSIVFKIEAKNTGVLRLYPGKKIYAMFLKMIKENSPETSQKMHNSYGDKPFTVSSFLGFPSWKGCKIEKNKSYYIRVTTLTEEIFQMFTMSTFKKIILQSSIYLENIEFKFKYLYMDGEKHKWSKIWDYEKVKEMNKSNIKMDFMTPTFFKMGEKQIRYPDAEKIFNGLLKKYNLYSKNKLDEKIRDNFKEIEISDMKIQTKKVDMKNYFLKGFVGRVEFSIDNKDERLIEVINILSEFSFFAGVGAKTTMGLGQVKRAENREQRIENKF